MRKVLLLVCVMILSSGQVLANHGCFIAKENNKIIAQEGDCATRFAPCSTFKIVLSLIGYDSGILIDEMHPVLPFKKGYPEWLEVWKQDQTPESWMKNSCVWYSQVLTQKLGMEKFQYYITKLNYGNMDLSGDKGKNNGLTNAWLSSSLEISPEEQLAFLQNLLENKLPVNQHAHDMTKNILFLEELPGGWKLYGKTGSGSLLSPDRMTKLEIQHGWFIGWIEKEGNRIIFVSHIVDDRKEERYAGPRAKEQTKEKILQFIQEIKS